MSSSATFPLSATLAFSRVRRARRLRAMFRGQPARMHEALRNLSRPAADAADTFEVSSRPIMVPAPGTAAAFGELVERQMQCGILRYSARLALLKQAARMKIERFEANLIIAAIQNRYRPQAKPKRPHRKLTLSAGPIALIFAAAEGLLVAAAWWHFVH